MSSKKFEFKLSRSYDGGRVTLSIVDFEATPAFSPKIEGDASSIVLFGSAFLAAFSTGGDVDVAQMAMHKIMEDFGYSVVDESKPNLNPSVN